MNSRTANTFEPKAIKHFTTFRLQLQTFY